MEKGQGNGTDTLQTDKVFTRKEYIEREAVLKWIDFVSDGYLYLETGTEFAKRDINAIPAADVAPVVRCRECKHFNDDDGDCRCVKDAEWDEETATWYGFVSYHMPDFFCADGERNDGDANVQNWEKNHLRPTNMSGTKCEPCKPTQPECGDCEYIKDGEGDV